MTDCNISLTNCSDFVINICETCCSCSVSSSSFEPTDVPGLLHWYKSDAGVTHISGAISQWDDLVATMNGTQSLAAQKPLLVENALNGYPMIRFNSGTLQNDPGLSADGSSKMDQLSFVLTSTIPQPYTVALVWQMWGPALGVFDGSGDDSKNYVFSTYDPSGSGAIYTIAGPSFHTPGANLQTNTSLSSAQVLNDAYTSGSQQFGLSFFIGNGANSKVINNLQLILSGNAGTDGMVNHFVLCGREPDTRGGAYFDLIEMMIFTGSLCDANIMQLQEYANDRYGLSIF